MQNESRKHNALVKCVCLIEILLYFVVDNIITYADVHFKTTKRLFFTASFVQISQTAVQITAIIHYKCEEK